MQSYLYYYYTRLLSFLTPNHSALDDYFLKLDGKMEALLARCNNVESKLDNDIKALNDEVLLYKSLLHTVADTIPDMLWCKDLDGKYIYANAAIKSNLLLSYDVLGKTDVELAQAAKAKYGELNHTFGEKCKNSDLVVIEKALEGSFKPSDGRFLESGLIKGKMVYLEVFKAPLFINGKLVGVVGGGRDLTEYVEAFRAHNCSGCHKMGDIFRRYEFE